MRLVDLNPHWVTYGGARLGITFDCPHCRQVRIGVPFKHAGYEQIDSSHILAVCPDAKIWTETNPADDSFDNLTLTPSIDTSASGHWHGFITNGEVT